MPAVAGTPESFLPRSDSKNPSTTCKGLTSNGRPCRRSLASTKSSANQGVFAVIPPVEDDEIADIPATAYFCWQHKDQASPLVQGSNQVLGLQMRSSIDTLMEKLGVLSTTDDTKMPERPKKSIPNRRASKLHQDLAGPISSPSKLADPLAKSPARTPLAPSRAVRKRQQQVHISLFCCTGRSHDDETLPPARPIPKVHPQKTVAIPFPEVRAPKTNSNTVSLPYRISPQVVVPTSLENHLSYIPTVLPSATRTALMMELTKPLTANDHEAGYIYIFWLTPKDVPHDAAQLASSLLQPRDTRPAIHNRRRTSDVLREFNGGVNIHNEENPNKIMLKIGRASNVHRRMIQWSQQCGQHITLLRYYPYHKSVSLPPSPHGRSGLSPRERMARQDSPSPTQKTPLAQRVERLIHIELAESRVKRDCEGCGKEHREWFQVDATRDGIKTIDNVVRRWIDWAQHKDSTTSMAFNDK